jgi:outer membrane protein OmpA-like peptidoglycan-associated protein
MTKNIILIFSMLLFAISANGQISQIKESVYFDSDKFELREAEEVKLTQLWDSLSTDSILRIYITGNTDNSADSFYNINLSKIRCNTIQDCFTSRNVSTDIFLVNYFGENKPIADNLSVQGKQENRRVDIKVIYKKQESLVIEEIIESVIDT